jgi:hypothetical protein
MNDKHLSLSRTMSEAWDDEAEICAEEGL